MSKLRELIVRLDEFKPTGSWLQRAIHRDNLEDYLMDNAEAIADLIDEAHKIGLTLREDHPLAIALAKLKK